ncbi:MAG: hypothetical protein JWL69_1796 [Phycisphaerales bacterium]|nr:hypothetical protein [Phycisphaerales bacterium]
MPKKKQAKPFTKMTPAERTAATKEFDREISFDETRPLSAKGKLLWERAKRGRGRPKLGTGAVKVLVTLDPELLERVDAYAKGKKLKRSQLIARALRKEIGRVRGADAR